MLVAHKIELRPTIKQEKYLIQACGAKRNVAIGSGDTINDCGGLALATNEAVTNLQN